MLQSTTLKIKHTQRQKVNQFKIHIMKLQEFRETRELMSLEQAENRYKSIGEYEKNKMCFVYLSGLHIFINPEVTDGIFQLHLNNSTFNSSNLTLLEERLYYWAMDKGYTLTGKTKPILSEAFISDLESFSLLADKISAKWTNAEEEEGENAQTLLSNLYPFEASFDDLRLDISRWVQNIKENNLK